MATRKTQKKPGIINRPWVKQIGTYSAIASSVAGIIIFYYSNRESDIKERCDGKLEYQKKDCERDNEERLLKLKLEVQTEYYQQVDEKSETAEKLEKVFNRIDQSSPK